MTQNSAVAAFPRYPPSGVLSRVKNYAGGNGTNVHAFGFTAGGLTFERVHDTQCKYDEQLMNVIPAES